MSYELLTTLFLFAFVTTGTPGPNNIMLTASGANFGIRRSIPHIAGISVGMMGLNVMMGLGLGALFIQFPELQQLLKIGGSGYLLWLSYKMLGNTIVTSSALTADDYKPLRLHQSALFQLVNPKAWVMVISANASFSLAANGYWQSIAAIIVVFILTGISTSTMWVVFGQVIRRYLSSPKRLQAFNITLATLTASCVWFIWQ